MVVVVVIVAIVLVIVPVHNRAEITPKKQFVVTEIPLTSTSDNKTIQLRSLETGTVSSVLWANNPSVQVSAVMNRNGSVLVAEGDYLCVTQIDRIDRSSFHITHVRTIDVPMSDMVVSPNGQSIAYMTYPNCADAIPTRTVHFGPNVLAITKLKTGATVTTATDMPGHPLDSLSWSPNGTQIVASYSGDSNYIAIFSATHPNFANAQRIFAPRGCTFLGSSWISSGIVTVKYCDPIPTPLAQHLVVVRPSGKILTSWVLPKCLNGFSLSATASARHAILLANIGFGNGACKSTGIQHQEIFETGLANLREIATWDITKFSYNLN